MKELAFSSFWYWLLLMAAVCYLIGCFNFAVLIARSKHKDVTKLGSGNPGTMNMTREFGLKVGLVNFLCDACKGGVPALVSYYIFRSYVFAGTEVLVSDFTRYFCGLFVILGHIWPVTMRFHGGKGIAASLGLYCFSLPCESPVFIGYGILALLVVLLYIFVTEWGSMGSLLGVSGLAFWQSVIFYLKYGDVLACGWVIGMFMLLLALVLVPWFAHRKNLVRLYAGEEHRTSFKKLYKGKRGTNNM